MACSTADPTYVAMFQQAAASINFDWPTTFCQICQESGWNPDADSGQAQGIAQFTPGTWSGYGAGGDVWDPQDSANAWAAYMAYLSGLYGGNIQQTLAAYNAGPGNVNKAIAKCGAGWLNCLPTSAANQAQTINYVNSITACAGSGAAPGSSVISQALGSLGIDTSSLSLDPSTWSSTTWIIVAAAAAAVIYFTLS